MQTIDIKKKKKPEVIPRKKRRNSSLLLLLLLWFYFHLILSDILPNLNSIPSHQLKITKLLY